MIKGLHHNAWRCRDPEAIETRGISDHRFIDSVYFRDPDGYVVELTTKTAEEHELLDRARARATLDEWQAAKA
jgi:catechol-2,3-dioxygenase